MTTDSQHTVFTANEISGIIDATGFLDLGAPASFMDLKTEGGTLFLVTEDGSGPMVLVKVTVSNSAKTLVVLATENDL